jgi:hypothetical protein
MSRLHHVATMRIRQDRDLGLVVCPGRAIAVPLLTTVAQPATEKGRPAAGVNLDAGPSRTEILSVSRVVRGSASTPKAERSAGPGRGISTVRAKSRPVLSQSVLSDAPTPSGGELSQRS